LFIADCSAVNFLGLLTMSDVDAGSGVLSVEIFSAMGQAGLVMMSVPCRCGLKWADTLRIDGLSMVAMQSRSIVPIDFPELTSADRDALVGLANAGERLAVGEFTACGLLDAYFLNVTVGR
jgi:hypothetical protein